MNHQHQLLDALETVMTWELPDEELANALNDQVRLIAVEDPEDTWDFDNVSHCPSPL
jgi:hypothetical protein